MKMKNWFNISIVLICILVLSACGSQQASKEGEKKKSDSSSIENLPSKMVWSVYDVGSGGYAEATAIANELTKTYGTQIRLLPSSSGVGRMQPMKNNMAFIGRLGDEYQFAFEGIYEFSEKSWGPQDLRVVWTPYSYFGLAVLEKSGIESINDLKGKKVPFITGNHSINIKTEAMLAFAGLTWDDEKKVEISSYGTQGDALKQGELDVVSMLPSASALFELDSLEGIKWLEMPENEKGGWGRVQEVAPWMIPGTMDNGAGMSKDNPANIMGYGYAVVAYANQSEDEIYALLKAFDATFDKWHQGSANLVNWGKDQIIVEPYGVPMHEGTIKFLKEEGLWTDEYEEKNNGLIERGKKLKEAWDQAVKEADKEGISQDKFPEYWLKKKNEYMK
ncbi:TAXI family TRAP transporter solute-binding subunit [Bacillus aquiflavi]|uniref:TAXI family TRAP transporter solute-binding subunit n=1 Tax=Bacillus aquiflavi TaxID=2672567 RepID=UPI001CA99337|nr:TAXI family TRAP transporter solute-binding subunit [Bacillus aquiflavi]UAC49729.1 TAXI family TRAP transporter solute-binding subunit [Bacillus aquiflavi]